MSKKAKAIRGMGKEQLNVKLLDLRKQLLKMNSQIAVGTSPESPGKVKQIKKEIARIFTIMNEPLKAKAPVKEAKAEAKAASAPKEAAVKKRAEVGKTK